MPLPITLCAIVRNSNGRLAKLIESHRELVSEVLIVDQYSTDGTYEEAQRLADRVLRKRCKATADPDRNWTFNLATHDYILYLDDDECLTEEAKKQLPELLKTGGDAFWFKRENYVDGISIEEILGDDIQCRLFKRGSVKFPDVIHTYPEGAVGIKVFYLDCAIRHDRTLEQIKQANKIREVVADEKALKLQNKFVQDVEALLKEKDGFSENWYSNDQLKLLTKTFEKVKDLEGAIIEIGCWEGKSTCALANKSHPEVVLAVDTWQGNIAEGERHPSVLKAKEKDVHSAFLSNVAARTKGNVQDCKKDCFEFLTNFKSPVKFCHIDAAHDYASVKKTIEMLKPLLVKGAVLCGDDFQTANINRADLQGGVERAVKELCPNYKVQGNFWYWVNP